MSVTPGTPQNSSSSLSDDAVEEAGLVSLLDFEGRPTRRAVPFGVVLLLRSFFSSFGGRRPEDEGEVSVESAPTPDLRPRAVRLVPGVSTKPGCSVFLLQSQWLL